MVELYDYQRQAICNFWDAIGAGLKRIVMVAPTGAGKTTIAAELIRRIISEGGQALFIAHRKELIDQAAERVSHFGVQYGVIRCGDERRNRDAPLQVASLQTLVRRQPPPAQLLIIDEAHRAMGAGYQRIIKAYDKAWIAGLTATPARLDGKGLGDSFQRLITVAQPGDLIGGPLIAPRIWAPVTIDTTGIKTRAGDYDAEAMSSRVIQLIGDVVTSWKRHASDRLTVAFCVTVEHSKAMAQSFRDAGIAAEHLDGTTQERERAAIFKRLATGKTRVLCNVGIAIEGWDLPTLGCVILARPTKSITIYLQAIGRALRNVPGKLPPIILDHANGIETHGHPLQTRNWQLTRTVQSEAANASQGIRCKECGFINAQLSVVCESCGAAIERKSRPLKVATREGDLKEWSGDWSAISACCKKCGARTPKPLRMGLYTLWVRCTTCGNNETHYDTIAAKRASMEEKRVEFLRLNDVARKRNYASGWVAHQYRAVFGVWPRGMPKDGDQTDGPGNVSRVS